MFLVFRGNDLHSGFGPTARLNVDEANAAINAMGPTRAVFVNYPSMLACQRTGPLSMSPSLNFWNSRPIAVHKQEQRHFSDELCVALGGSRSKANRLAREAVFYFLNALHYAGLTIRLDATTLLTNMSYVDSDGKDTSIERPPFDVAHDAESMYRWWQYYSWYKNLCAKYLIRITKDEYRKTQASISVQNRPSNLQPASAIHFERQPATLALPTFDLGIDLAGDPEHVVESICARRLINGKVSLATSLGGNFTSFSFTKKVVWTVKVQGQESELSVDEKTTWQVHSLCVSC